MTYILPFPYDLLLLLRIRLDCRGGQALFQDYLADFLAEVGILCSFSRSWGDWYRRLYPAMLRAATGVEAFSDMRYLGGVSDRIVTLERALNVRRGIRRRQDSLPKRFLTEPLHTGTAPGEGQRITGLEGFLDDYYRLRGWTTDGIPSREKLEALGLGSVAGDLASITSTRAD